jgi:hypothetical protein
LTLVEDAVATISQDVTAKFADIDDAIKAIWDTMIE